MKWLGPLEFLKNTKRDPTTNCYIWLGSKDRPNGYGRIRYRGTMTTLSRLMAYLLKDFDLNSKLEVCHKCDTPSCINPDHLWIGTTSENHRDSSRKRRKVNNFKPFPHGNQFWTMALEKRKHV